MVEIKNVRQDGEYVAFELVETCTVYHIAAKPSPVMTEEENEELKNFRL